VLIRELPLNLVQRPAEWPKLHPIGRTDGRGFPARVGREFPATISSAYRASRWRSASRPIGPPTAGITNTAGARPSYRRSRPAAIWVSNGEFHAFVTAGAIANHATGRRPAGRGVVPQRQVATFWAPEDGWSAPLQVAHPVRGDRHALGLAVDVNYHEAKAYGAGSPNRRARPTDCQRAEHQALRGVQQRDARPSRRADPVMRFDGASLARECGWILTWPGVLPGRSRPGRPTRGRLSRCIRQRLAMVGRSFHPLPGARSTRNTDDFSTPATTGQASDDPGRLLGVHRWTRPALWARFHFPPAFLPARRVRPGRSTDDGGAVRLDRSGSPGQVYEAPQS